MDREAEQPDGSRHGPGFVAAVCVRDHWDEMSVEERDWCVDVVVSEILRQSDQWSQVEQMQRFSMGCRPPLCIGGFVAVWQDAHRGTNAARPAGFRGSSHAPHRGGAVYMTWGIDRQF